MAGEQGPELPSQFRLPKVDRQAVRALFALGAADFIDEELRFYTQYPVLLQSTLLEFPRLSETDRNSIYAAVAITGILLAKSQPRTGGTIPPDISIGAIQASIKALKETPGEVSSTVEELFDQDPELFMALTRFSTKPNQSTSIILQGGHLLLKIYNHILEGNKLAEDLGL